MHVNNTTIIMLGSIGACSPRWADTFVNEMLQSHPAGGPFQSAPTDDGVGLLGEHPRAAAKTVMFANEMLRTTAKLVRVLSSAATTTPLGKHAQRDDRHWFNFTAPTTATTALGEQDSSTARQRRDGRHLGFRERIVSAPVQPGLCPTFAALDSLHALAIGCLPVGNVNDALVAGCDEQYTYDHHALCYPYGRERQAVRYATPNRPAKAPAVWLRETDRLLRHAEPSPAQAMAAWIVPCAQRSHVDGVARVAAGLRGADEARCMGSRFLRHGLAPQSLHMALYVSSLPLDARKLAATDNGSELDRRSPLAEHPGSWPALILLRCLCMPFISPPALRAYRAGPFDGGTAKASRGVLTQPQPRRSLAVSLLLFAASVSLAVVATAVDVNFNCDNIPEVG
ncbi:hypothetical protein AURDEDRAFT_167851 [Auricularia subglabra TFB-10046 SS5]|nr:hypothetical protein AURDEDRAFT_167851 [Auricularia subglabra TFB-10046 SS5]